MQFKNWVPTLGGYLTALGSVPVIAGTIANQFPSIPLHIPGRIYGLCILMGALGVPMIGLSAKGKDEHSTVDQVQQSSKDNKARMQ